jgi:hypothetical protein
MNFLFAYPNIELSHLTQLAMVTMIFNDNLQISPPVLSLNQVVPNIEHSKKICNLCE